MRAGRIFVQDLQELELLEKVCILLCVEWRVTGHFQVKTLRVTL